MTDVPPVDSITAPTEAPPPRAPPVAASRSVDPVVRGRLRVLIGVLIGIPYLLFLGWCLFLMSVLPSPSGQFESLIPVGVLSSTIGIVVFILFAGLLARRILQKRALSATVRLGSSLRLMLLILPGLAMAAIVPFTITEEPRLPLRVIDPLDTETLEAPLPVTFSLEEAVIILRRRNFEPISYRWDFTGDGTIDNTSVEPTATAVYSRSGLYTVNAVIDLQNGGSRRVMLRLPIQKEVFSVKPFMPLVDEPVLFSVAHLIGTISDEDGELVSDLREVQWDFDGDSVPDEVTKEPEVAHTFVRTGPVRVSVTVLRENQGQQRYEKEIMISEPPPLPFPVSIVSLPENLIGPVPFPAQFRIETAEPLRSVQWDFGDGEKKEGLEVGHTFQRIGDFIVSAEVRAEKGDIARLTEQVRVTKLLELRDLSITGSHEVDPHKAVIEGEVPLTLQLTARTGRQLISFSWEAPDATLVGSTDRTLEATYRRAGTYTITLFAQDPDGQAMRLPIVVTVKPPSAYVSLRMNPTKGRAPLEVTFDATETAIPNEEITGFVWLFGDEPENAAPEYAAGIIRHIYERPGEYEVTVTALTTQNNEYSKTAKIVVSQPLLTACFQPSRTEFTAPGGVAFDASCTAGLPERGEWDFGDGAKSDQRAPQHEYLTPGTYPVQLTIWQGTMQDTYTVTITVR